ncbi:MAG: lipoyl synthase [Candidatus Omnitrophica bacterium]|nr:lipoyl synthase [Candidatus Omnitrophota bacterium]
MSDHCCRNKNRLPEWFRQEIPDPDRLQKMRGLLKDTGLKTVCEGAHCPNMGACWEKGAATFLILGENCSRQCRFCAVTHGIPSEIDFDEPLQVADAVSQLGLRYVVITSVTRDDLPDGGAGQFARTVRAVKELSSGVQVEVLIPDFLGAEDLIRVIADSDADVIGHNLETVRRLASAMRSGADYDRSLGVLRAARRLNRKAFIKSGLMVGLGESKEEVLVALQDLKDAGCDIVTIGQYLAPSKEERHAPVDRFVTPEEFSFYKVEGLQVGFKFVHAGPLVRSSYLAEEGFQCCKSAEGALAG